MLVLYGSPCFEKLTAKKAASENSTSLSEGKKQAKSAYELNKVFLTQNLPLNYNALNSKSYKNCHLSALTD